MGEIKDWKQLLIVELRDGTVLRSERTMEELEAYLNTPNPILNIDGVLFSRFQFKKAYVQKIDDMEDFILSHEKETQDVLRAILADRKTKYLKTNGTTHLRAIYLKKTENENKKETP